MIRTIMTFFGKSQRLAKISRTLGRPANYRGDLQAMFRNADARREAEEQLLDLVQSTEVLRPVLQRFGATREDLAALYHELEVGGGAVWVRGHWVAASALCFGQTLQYALEARSRGACVADRECDVILVLIEYFAQGRVSLRKQ